MQYDWLLASDYRVVWLPVMLYTVTK